MQRIKWKKKINQTEQTIAHHMADANEYLPKKIISTFLKWYSFIIRMFSLLQAKKKLVAH